jgi:hypothetical protein
MRTKSGSHDITAVRATIAAPVIFISAGRGLAAPIAGYGWADSEQVKVCRERYA